METPWGLRFNVKVPSVGGGGGGVKGGWILYLTTQYKKRSVHLGNMISQHDNSEFFLETYQVGVLLH